MNQIWETVRRQSTRDSHFSEGDNYNATNQGFSTFNTWTVDYVADSSDVLRHLKAYAAPEAIHTSRDVDGPGCVCNPGTRNHTLGEIERISLDPAPPDLIWLNGPPGAGKTAVMRSTAKRLDNEGTLLASFFFFRSDPRSNTSASLATTLALQTCSNLPQVQPYIAHSIRQNPTLFSQPSHLQCLHLLQTPLINLLSAPLINCGWTSTSPRVIVVDGLDECMQPGPHMQTEPGAKAQIIKTLAQLASAIRAETKCHIKIIVASRPELEIKTEFARLQDDGKATVVSLDMSDAELDLLYAQHFREIRETYRLTEDWPSKDDLNWLVDNAFGSYSFADTLTRHLAAKDPVHRLQIIRQTCDKERGGTSLRKLDILYGTILQQLPSKMLQPALLILRLRFGTQPGWRDGYISMLEPLLQLPQGFLSHLSPYLSSLVDFDNNLRPYHATLSEFLHDAERSGAANLAFDLYEPLFSQTVTKGLLKLTSVRQRPSSPVEKQTLLSLLLYLEGKIYPERTTLSHFITPEDYPSSTEIVELIDAVDASSFDFWAFSYFARLCDLLRPLYINGRSTAAQSLTSPGRMKATWREKAALYRQCGIDDAAELIIGLLTLCFTATHRNRLTVAVVAGLIKHIIQSNRRLSEMDITVGWNLLDVFSTLEPGGVSKVPGFFLDAILQYEDAAYTSRCLQVVFDTILKAENKEHVHHLVADYMDYGLVGSLSELQLCIVQCWSSTEYTAARIPTLEHLDTLYSFIQSREWVQPSLINAVKSYVQCILYSRQFSLIPSFASLQKRKLLTMHTELTARAKYLAELD